MAVRPESIRIEAAGASQPGANQIRAVVEQVIYRGLNTQYLLHREGAEPLIVLRQNDDGRALGYCPGRRCDGELGAARNRVVRADG